MGGLFLLVFVSPRITYLTPFPENIYKDQCHKSEHLSALAKSINTATLQDSNFERQPFNIVTRTHYCGHIKFGQSLYLVLLGSVSLSLLFAQTCTVWSSWFDAFLDHHLNAYENAVPWILWVR